MNDRTDLKLTIDALDAVNVDTSDARAALADADRILNLPTPDPLSTALAALDNGHADPATVGKVIVDAVAARNAATAAGQVARQLADTIAGRAVRDLRANADRLIEQIRPTFDQAADLVRAAHAAGVGPLDVDHPAAVPLHAAGDTLAAVRLAVERLTRDDNVARYLDADAVGDVLPAAAQFDEPREPVEAGDARWRNPSFGLLVFGLNVKYAPAAGWLALLAAGHGLHLNTAEVEKVREASAAKLAAYKAKRAA